MAVKGDAADLVRDAQCGQCCKPENPASIAQAIQRLAASDPRSRAVMGENGRKFYREQLSIDVGVGRFEEVFRAAVRT